MSNSTKKKYRYNVRIGAEGVTTGTINLSKKEAAVVAYATDPNNWENIHDEDYCGRFEIDVEHPMEIEEV